MRFVVVVVLVALVSCAAEHPPPAIGDATHADSPPGSEAAYHRYTGTLAKAGPVQFGGSGYCDYTVALESITVEAVLLDRRSLEQLVVTDTRIETPINGCMFGGQPPNAQVYEHVGPAVPIEGGTVLPVMTGAAGNAPTALLTISISGILDNATMGADANWKRTDQAPPLDWRVTTPSSIPLAIASCIPGDPICVGRAQGYLYTCSSDGVSLATNKQCANGCASTTACQ